MISFHEVMKLQNFEFGVGDIIQVFRPWFVNFMEKELSTKSYGVFDHFAWNYEVSCFE